MTICQYFGIGTQFDYMGSSRGTAPFVLLTDGPFVFLTDGPFVLLTDGPFVLLTDGLSLSS